MYNNPFIQEQFRRDNISLGLQEVSVYTPKRGGEVEYETRTSLKDDEIVGLYFDGAFKVAFDDPFIEIQINNRIVYTNNPLLPFAVLNQKKSVFFFRETAKGSNIKIKYSSNYEMKLSLMLITAKYKEIVLPPSTHNVLETIQLACTNKVEKKHFELSMNNHIQKVKEFFLFILGELMPLKNSTLDLYINGQNILHNHDVGLNQVYGLKAYQDVSIPLNIEAKKIIIEGTYHQQNENWIHPYNRNYNLYLAFLCDKKAIY